MILNILLTTLYKLSICSFAQDIPIILNGEKLSIEEVIKVARFNQKVKIDPKALEKVKRSHQLLLIGAKFNLPIYGLNLGRQKMAI